MGFQLQEKSITFTDFECQFTAGVSVMCTVTTRLKLESRGFCCKVAIYLSYRYVKFNDEIQT